MGVFDQDDLQRAVAALGQLAAVAMGALVVTGVPLTLVYDPDGPGWLSGLHAVASALLVGSAVGLVGCVAIARLRRLDVWVGWALALSGFVVAAAGAVTGQVLRWTAVEPPDAGARGLVGPLGGDVDTVIVGDGELSPSALLVWALVHVVVLPAAAAGVAVWLRRRRRAPSGRRAGGQVPPADQLR